MHTIKNLVEEAVEKNSEKVLLTDLGNYFRKSFTYNDVYLNSLRICSFFQEKKIKKGDKILLYLPNSSNYVTLLFACALSGVIAVPVDFNSNAEFARKISKIVESKICFCSVLKSLSSRNVFYVEEISKIYEGFNPIKKKVEIKPSDTFEIVYTSGTTSEPKGVVLTQENLASDLEFIRESNILNVKNPSMLSILPLSHLFEQTVGLFSPIQHGGRISYLESRKNSEIISAIKNQKVNTMVVVPFFLDSLKSKILAKVGERINLFKKIKIRRSFSRLKYLFVGGSSLSLETERFWKKLGFEILQGYGLTETSPVLTCNSTKFYREGTVGKALKGIELKTIEKEIITKGKNVFRGYYKAPIKTKEVIKNEWFYTGDLGEIDEQGYLKVTGRKKNVILSSSGLNIYPEDIERSLNKIEGVKDSVVLGLNEGKELIGVILSDKILNLEEIKKEINERLNPSQQLSRIIIWSEKDFPRTPTLKVIRRRVEESISGENFEKKPDEDNLKNIISSICNYPPEKMKENSKLIDFGLDSIKRIELVNKIEEEYNLDFDEKNINEKTTLAILRKEIKTPEKDKSESQITFLNSKIFNPVRFILQQLSFLMLKPFYSIEVQGRENLPKENCILIANHTSMLDTFAIYRSLPLRYRMNTCPAAAKDFFFKNWITGLFGKLTFNAFGFSRKEETKQSLRDFGELVKRGMNVLIYPEGTRSRKGNLLEFKEGIGILAWNIPLKIVPIKIQGLHEILPVGKIWPRRGRVKIKIGKPIQFNRMNSPHDITNILHKTLERM